MQTLMLWVPFKKRQFLVHPNDAFFSQSSRQLLSNLINTGMGNLYKIHEVYLM